MKTVEKLSRRRGSRKKCEESLERFLNLRAGLGTRLCSKENVTLSGIFFLKNNFIKKTPNYLKNIKS